MARTAADFITSSLAQVGVKRVYGVVGDSLNGFSDSLRRFGEIGWVHMRNEEAAAFAAGAEAHLTGELAVCAGSCGPGNLHLINGLFDCHRSRVPVLAIAAHIPSSEIGIDYFQATHPESLFKDCSHYVELVSGPQQLPQILRPRGPDGDRQTGRRCRGYPRRRGPSAPRSRGPGLAQPAVPVVRPVNSDISRLAALLNGTSKVTLFCGAGCAGAHRGVLALAEKLKAPIVHALRGKEHVEYDNPYDVGMTGLIGFASGYVAMKACDTLLMLGTDFPYRQFYPETCPRRANRPQSRGSRQSLPAGARPGRRH